MGATAKDSDEKVRRGYRDKNTIVWANGRERLEGRDWRKRKKELAERSRGRCERVSILGKPHETLCYGRGDEPHHIQKRSVLRDDRLSNLAHLSHACHLAEDDRKIRSDKKERREHPGAAEKEGGV